MIRGHIILEPLGSSIEIPVPTKDQKVGIAMSGGMDSALLAYYLLNKLDANDVTIYTVDLGKSVEYVQKIIEHIAVGFDHIHTGKKTMTVLENPKNPNGALSPLFINELDNVDYFYTATTKNPPWADKIPEGQKPYRYVKTQYKNMLMPFGTSLKSHIVEMYRIGRLNDLLKLTHTCTESTDSHCGLCFACRERWWAFNTIGAKDCIEYDTYEAFGSL